jgi:hypothetical protein
MTGSNSATEQGVKGHFTDFSGRASHRYYNPQLRHFLKSRRLARSDKVAATIHDRNARFGSIADLSKSLSNLTLRRRAAPNSA